LNRLQGKIMSDLNQHQKQFLSATVKKLSGAMKKIKFHSAISVDEAATIRKEIDDAKGSLSTFSDINPNVKHVDLFKQAADLIEELSTVFASRNQHLV